MRKPFSASAALALAACAIAAAGCGGSDEPDADATATVYVSLPLRGPSGPDGRDAADGARMALADAHDEAGGVGVEAKYLDDTQGAGSRARWTPVQAAANARAATQDSTSIAYLGDFESGATRASLPVTNSARLLQVSPASSAQDLVESFPGSDEVPQSQPSGDRTFGRVIPGDTAQGAAGADWVGQPRPAARRHAQRRHRVRALAGGGLSRRARAGDRRALADPAPLLRRCAGRPARIAVAQRAAADGLRRRARHRRRDRAGRARSPPPPRSIRPSSRRPGATSPAGSAPSTAARPAATRPTATRRWR